MTVLLLPQTNIMTHIFHDHNSCINFKKKITTKVNEQEFWHNALHRAGKNFQNPIIKKCTVKTIIL